MTSLIVGIIVIAVIAYVANKIVQNKMKDW